MNVLKHQIGELWRSTVTTLRRPKIGVKQIRGRLTPAQFVEAGDNLTAKCPTWEWMSSDADHCKEYLPPNKQYLVCKRGSYISLLLP